MRKTYKHVTELSKPVWPRHIADDILDRQGKIWDAELVSVKDLQHKKDVYEDVYKVK